MGKRSAGTTFHAACTGLRGRCALSMLLLASMLASGAAVAADDCAPCGDWKLERGGPAEAEAAVDAALARYEPPRVRRRRVPAGDIEAATRAEFEASLAPPGTLEDRAELRVDLLRATAVPAELSLRTENGNLVVVSDGASRRLRPGDPHSRVDALGTARIEAQLRGSRITVSETYDRRTGNRTVYAYDSRSNRLTVTHSIERRGLPDVSVQSTYAPR